MGGGNKKKLAHLLLWAAKAAGGRFFGQRALTR